MQVFICWSGSASHKVAEAFKSFLEDTIQGVKPFLSSDSIQKGGRWLTEVSKQLSACNFGILCLTKENLTSRWLLFEAGALSKDSAEGRVSALLIGVDPSAVESPLSQFQHTRVDSNDVSKLLKTINNLLPEPERRSETQLARAFEKYWPDLKTALDEAAALKSAAHAAPLRNSESILKEVLELVRGLARDAETAKQQTVPAFTYGSQISPALLDVLTKGLGGPTGPIGAVYSGNSFVRGPVGALSALEPSDLAKAAATITASAVPASTNPPKT